MSYLRECECGPEVAGLEAEIASLRARCEAAEASVREVEAHLEASQKWGELEQTNRLAAESQRDRAVEVLRGVEWSHIDADDLGYCRVCEGGFPVHAIDCALASVNRGEGK